jgi:hypothetical protein
MNGQMRAHTAMQQPAAPVWLRVVHDYSGRTADTPMSTFTIYFAQLAGLYFIILGVILVVRKRSILELMRSWPRTRLSCSWQA